MKSYTTQLKMDIKRLIMRNPKFVIFDVGIPVAFYVLFTKVLNAGMPSSFDKSYMVNMAIYATLLSSIVTVANNILSDQEEKYLRFIDVSPVSRIVYYTSIGTALMILTLLEVLVIELVGYFYVGVSLPISSLLWALVIVTIASIPLTVFGVLLAYTGSSSLVNLLVYLIVFPVAILSGLWWPLQMLPAWGQHIGKLLPTYQTSVIVNNVIQNQSFSMKPIIILLSWFIVGAFAIIGTQKIQKMRVSK